MQKKDEKNYSVFENFLELMHCKSLFYFSKIIRNDNSKWRTKDSKSSKKRRKVIWEFKERIE